LAARAFPHPVDPCGGEVGTLRRLLDQFLNCIPPSAKSRRQTKSNLNN